MAKVHEYLAQIPPASLATIFKKAEVEPDIFAGMLESFAEHGLDDATKTGNFFVGLTKASNFDMLFMFAEDKEHEAIKKIGAAIKKQNSALAALFTKAYANK